MGEWCFDYYGYYGPSTGSGTVGVTNPAGASEGTRRVYRGGGWNDFGKNLRSAYRAALHLKQKLTAKNGQNMTQYF